MPTRPPQPLNAPRPMLVTPSGIVTETRFAQSRNAPTGSPAADCALDTRRVQTFVPTVWVRTCSPDVQGCQRKDPPPPANMAVNPSTVTVTVSPVRGWASMARGVSSGTASPSSQAAGTDTVGAVPVQSLGQNPAPHPIRTGNATKPKTIEYFMNCPLSEILDSRIYTPHLDHTRKT